jgi:serine/threonine-protein kinase
VHRDIKPENLFIARAGDGSDWVKVLDFGIAKLRQVDATVATRTGVAMGTALYMSPEQARGAASVDERTDVWSLGVVLYQLLSGRRPFEGGQFLEVIYQILSVDPKPLSELRPDLPRGLYEVVARAMDKDLSRRLPSVNALAQLLEPFAVGGVYAALQLADSGNARTVSASETYPSASTSTGGVALARSGPFAFHGASGLPPSLGSGAPLSPSAQEVTHVRAGRWRRVLVGATLAGLTGGAVWWYTQQPAVSALVPVAAGSAMAHTAGAEAEFTAHPSLVAASPVEASAARRGSPSLSATEPSPALATPGQSLPRVRSASEHGERRPNVPEPVRAEVHTPNLVSAGAVVGVAPPAAAPPAQRDSEPHPARGTQNSKIQIEEGNPYEH